MSLSYTEIVILHCLQRIEGQRTVYSVFHLLNGKKTSQTIQDAHLFHLSAFFHLFPSLTRKEFTDYIKRMENEQLIIQKEDLHFVVPKRDHWKAVDANILPKYVDGWRYHRYSRMLWERISLLVQVISHLNKQNQKYLPIQTKKELHVWLKKYLVQSKMSREDLAQGIYNELYTCLSHDDDINPVIFVIRLTGFNKIGLTASQAAEKLKMENDVYHIHFLNILHCILQKADESPEKFPLLNRLMTDVDKLTSLLTISASRTYRLIQKGFALDEISISRNLKRGTIEDHIVEIALNISDFKIDQYVSQLKQQLIVEASKKLTSKQLKHIRQSVPEADYFEIRLVLAKNGIR
ncbi:helix-turn-helix domain-containing protein [Cytobacillus purgationiresistens]|uniref:Uncharacterized protein YpbB n=1 Tax=Cytobacillus purgationiresistens TaxID=863449 RepID=A0ABU0AK24_9BACI|nr:helix-turn-helix domain-containing protein [Cytobacillus purgationiresistens]MDQ0271117.1 uncharacterized protein YpbB [Cytobacillus purgationiresistens]